MSGLETSSCSELENEEIRGGPHLAVFIPEILSAIFSHCNTWDLESGLQVCRVWRSALASSVTRLALPVRVSECGLTAAPSIPEITCESWLRAVFLFSEASYISIKVTGSHPGVVLEIPEEAQAALQWLLSRATALELTHDFRSRPPDWAGSNPRGSQPHHGPHHAQRLPPDAWACLQALLARGGERYTLPSLKRLQLGCSWRIAVPVAGLSELLPGLTSLDLVGSGVADTGFGLFPSFAAARADMLIDCADEDDDGDEDDAGELLATEARCAGASFLASRGAGGGHGTLGMTTPAAAASLDLVTAQGLFQALPRHLRHLSASVGITEYDRMVSWAVALSSMPPGLTSLRLLGPLCHSPDLAEAVAGWALKLPCLRRLELALAECCHSHPDLEAQLYDDPESWTSSSWHGAFPALTQLRALQLSMENISDGLWCDVRSCSHLMCLRLLPTSWSGMCEAAGICYLTGLRELALTVSEPSELEELSTLSQLTKLDLEMVGITCDDSSETCGSSAAANRRRGLLHRVTGGLVRLRRFSISCRSATISAEELGLLKEHCPELTRLRIRAPFQQPSPLACAANTVSLPPRLRVLRLENVRMTSCTSSMPGGILRLAMLPAEIVVLALEGLDLELLSGLHDGMNASVKGSVGQACGAEDRGPSTLVIKVVRCTLGCALEQLCGKELRSLDLIGTCLLGNAQGMRSPGTGAGGLASLRCRCQLRRLRIWGCMGQLRPLNDEAMHELVNQHPHLVDVALNASFATRSGLSALAKLKSLRRLKIAVVGQECAAALGPGLTCLQRLTELEVVLPALNFVGDCVRAHLAGALPNAQVRLRAQGAGD